MFGFWDGLKMRMLALMAMLLTAAPAAVATAKITPATTSAPKIAATQTVTPPVITPKETPKDQVAAQKPPTPTAPSSTPVIAQPAGDTLAPVKPKKCSCAPDTHKGYKCEAYCRYLNTQTAQKQD